jgi:hypothetical protein
LTSSSSSSTHLAIVAKEELPVLLELGQVENDLFVVGKEPVVVLKELAVIAS